MMEPRMVDLEKQETNLSRVTNSSLLFLQRFLLELLYTRTYRLLVHNRILFLLPGNLMLRAKAELSTNP